MPEQLSTYNPDEKKYYQPVPPSFNENPYASNVRGEEVQVDEEKRREKLERYKEYNKQIEQELDDIFRTDNLPFTTKGKSKGLVIYKFVVSPPYYKTNDNLEGTRYTPSANEIVIAFHMPEDENSDEKVFVRAIAGTDIMANQYQQVTTLALRNKIRDVSDTIKLMLTEKKFRGIAEKFVDFIEQDPELINIDKALKNVTTISELENFFKTSHYIEFFVGTKHMQELLAWHIYKNAMEQVESTVTEEEIEKKVLEGLSRKNLINYGSQVLPIAKRESAKKLRRDRIKGMQQKK